MFNSLEVRRIQEIIALYLPTLGIAQELPSSDFGSVVSPSSNLAADFETIVQPSLILNMDFGDQI